MRSDCQACRPHVARRYKDLRWPTARHRAEAPGGAHRSRFRLALPTEGSPTQFGSALCAPPPKSRSFVTDEPRSLNMACLESHLGFAGRAIAHLKSVT